MISFHQPDAEPKFRHTLDLLPGSLEGDLCPNAKDQRVRDIIRAAWLDDILRVRLDRPIE